MWVKAPKKTGHDRQVAIGRVQDAAWLGTRPLRYANQVSHPPELAAKVPHGRSAPGIEPKTQAPTRQSAQAGADANGQYRCHDAYII
jgi:hypothetical protein